MYNFNDLIINADKMRQYPVLTRGNNGFVKLSFDCNTAMFWK